MKLGNPERHVFENKPRTFDDLERKMSKGIAAFPFAMLSTTFATPSYRHSLQAELNKC
jgi:hypothetical protein